MHVRQNVPLVALVLLAGCSSLLGPTPMVQHFLEGAKHNDPKAMYECLASSQQGGVDAFHAFQDAVTNKTGKPKWLGVELEPKFYSLFFSSPASFKIVSTEVVGNEASIVVALEYAADRAPVFVSSARIVSEPQYYGVRPIFFHPGGDGPLGPRFRTDPELSAGAEFDRKKIVLTSVPIKTARIEFRATCDLAKRWWISAIRQPYAESPNEPLVVNRQAAAHFTFFPSGRP